MAAKKNKAESPSPADAEARRAKGGRAMVQPFVRHSILSGTLLEKITTALPADHRPDQAAAMNAVIARADKVRSDGPLVMGDVLTAQAISLDQVFAEFARLAAANIYTSLDATERLMRLALKAQAGSRATIEALAKLHQPREQTVRHVHVNEGGQAVIADEFHHHTGGAENAGTVDQPHATGTGTGAAGASPALPCPDPLGPAVPIPGGEGQGAMQDARRQG